MAELTTIDKIFKLMLEESERRKDLSTELNLLMICLEILDRFRTATQRVKLIKCPTEHLDSKGEIL